MLVNVNNIAYFDVDSKSSDKDLYNNNLVFINNDEEICLIFIFYINFNKRFVSNIIKIIIFVKIKNKGVS